MRILIAVPTFETIYPDTYKSIYDLNGGDHTLIFDFVRGYDCATARNNIAQRSLNYKVDYVLMVDNDVVIPQNVLLDMLEDARDVCLGYYAHRNNENVYTGRVSVCKLLQPNGKAYYNYPLESEYTAEEMAEFRNNKQYKIRIHGGGMGCALIKTDVFNTIKYPWYDWVNYADDNRGMLSEDLYFCEQCRKNGIPVFTDSRAACGHILRHIQYV